MSSTEIVDNVEMRGQLRFITKVVGALPADGVLVVDVSSANHYILDNGAVLKGIRFESDGEPFEEHREQLDDHPTRSLASMIMISSAGVATATAEVVAVTAEERITVPTGASTTFITANRLQVFAAFVPGTGWRVEIPDWSVSAHSVPYTATTPGDWAGSAPVTVGEALDRLAAANTGA